MPAVRLPGNQGMYRQVHVHKKGGAARTWAAVYNSTYTVAHFISN